MTDDRLLTAAELAEVLGFSAGTIVDWAERGTIPAFKLGGRLRFRESEVLNWLERQRMSPGASLLVQLPAYSLEWLQASERRTHEHRRQDPREPTSPDG